MVEDAWRFVRSFRSLIEEAPLQTYCSALLFAPEKSIVRRIFEKEMPRSVKVISSMAQGWSPCLQILESSGDVLAVAISPDGSQLASASWDSNVRLWDVVTGVLLLTLVGHTSYVNAVVFSPDGSQLASGSGDGIMRIWDAATGASLRILQGPVGSVNSITFRWDGS